MIRRARTWDLRWLWLFPLLAAGCSHTPLPIPPQPIEAYPFRQTQAGVRVALDPYFTRDRLQVAFSGGEEFADKGLLPVRVIIEDASPGGVQVDPRNFRLLRPDGKTEIALSPQDAAAQVRRSMGWWALGTGLVGGAASAYENEGRLKSLEARALKEVAIPEGGSATGFVYFPISDTERTLAGNRVLFPLLGPGGRGLTFEIAIDGRRDIPVPAARRDVAEPAKPPAPTPLNPQNPQSPTRIEGTGGGVIIRSPQ